jgi:hypothetical protein
MIAAHNSFALALVAVVVMVLLAFPLRYLLRLGVSRAVSAIATLTREHHKDGVSKIP